MLGGFLRPLLVVAAILLAGCTGDEPAAPAGVADDAPAPPTAADADPTPVPVPAPSVDAAGACVRDPCDTFVAPGFFAEPWIAVDPTAPQRLVVASFGSMDGAQGMFASRSEDGGATWTTLRLPGDPESLAAQVGGAVPSESPLVVRDLFADSMAAFTPQGDLVVAGLLLRDVAARHEDAFVIVRAVDLVVWRSADGGASFSLPEVVARGDGFKTLHPSAEEVPQEVWWRVPSSAATWHDKPFLVADRATGTLHLFWNPISNPQAVYLEEGKLGGGTDVLLVSSGDGGKTWSEPVLVATGKYGVSAAAHNGTLLATFRNPVYQLARSTDGGRTWSEPADVGDLPGPTSTWQAAPVALWESAGVLKAALARAEGEQGEGVVLQVSDDLGRTWSEATRVLPANASWKRNPVLAVDPFTGAGVVAAWQGATEAQQLEVWAAPLQDGTPGAATRVSSGTIAQWAVFEYFGAAAHDGRAHLAYPLAGEGDGPLHVASLAVAAG